MQSIILDGFVESWNDIEEMYAKMLSVKKKVQKKKTTDSFVIGYDTNSNDESALVVLRPVDATKSADYDFVCSYTGEMADIIYALLCGVKGVDK